MPLIAPLLLALALLLGPAAAARDGEQPPACRGNNLLDELQGTEAHARILSAAAAALNSQALLWRIEHPDKAPSHLFGTVHLTDDRVSANSPAVREALAGSRRLVLEIEDVSPGNFARAFVRARDLMMFRDGRRLDQLLSEPEFQRVAGILARSGLPAELFSGFRPWVASLMLALSDCEQLRIRHGLLPLDSQLARDAQSLGIGVAGLETLELQLRAMASVPEEDQLNILKASLRMYDRIDDVIETTVQLYLARQLGAIWPLQQALAEQVGVAPQAFDSAEQSLLVIRNHGMRDKAAAHLEAGGAFIAVGALHLPGRQGLVALLREAGYTLTPVE